jgi:GT2 family glycosyltransferase
MNSPKVTIQIVSWNSLKYLGNCLESLRAQTYRDFQILVIDNNSHDGTVKFLKLNYPDVAVFQNNKNLGFAKANNQGIKLLGSPFILLCNPDIMLEPNWLERMMTEVEKPENNQVGSFGGKILRLKMLPGDFNEVQKTNVIDSCGLVGNRGRRFSELGAGLTAEEFEVKREVFGHSGALVLFRREALDSSMIKIGEGTGEYFDEDFFCYKEDVDLAWRLQLLGWKSFLIPLAVAYHVRSMSGSEKKGLNSIFKNRQRQSPLSRYYSYRNHFYVLLKNEALKDFFKNFWQIIWQEKKKFWYVLVLEPKNLRAIGEVISLWFKMRKKRKIIKARQVVTGVATYWFK